MYINTWTYCLRKNYCVKTDCKPKEAVKYSYKSVCIYSKYKKCQVNAEISTLKQHRDFDVKQRRENVEISMLKQRRSFNVAANSGFLYVHSTFKSNQNSTSFQR